jgi:hypothetical protein
MPAAAQADRALGWSARDRTTASTVWFFRNDRRRVPKWYSSAPNGSGRIDTCPSRRHGRSRSKAPWTSAAGLPVIGLVDTAHAVDRDFLDQQLVGGQFLVGALGHMATSCSIRGYARLCGTQCQTDGFDERNGTWCRNQAVRSRG